QRRERVAVEVIGAHVEVGDGSGGAVAARIEHGDAVAEALRGHAEHAAELSAAEEAEPRARRHARDGGGGRCGHYGAAGGTRIARALAVCATRIAVSRWASPASVADSIAAANSAALAAPASPIANVATGM